MYTVQTIAAATTAHTIDSRNKNKSCWVISPLLLPLTTWAGEITEADVFNPKS